MFSKNIKEKFAFKIMWGEPIVKRCTYRRCSRWRRFCSRARKSYRTRRWDRAPPAYTRIAHNLRNPKRTVQLKYDDSGVSYLNTFT